MNGINDIRAAFLGYFKSDNHEIVPSDPLIPRNDPSLMFVSAGMVPFKNVFTGLEKRDYQRAATSQKCLRAGGKHNDLDSVGYTARHHTFFEMLGNFSFGDYFKERAIELAWNLLVKEFGLPEGRLLATVYHTDNEAFELWKKISGLPEEKIIRIATDDNFWSMGDTGPCGPCSEVFYDHGEGIVGGPPGSPEENGDRFTEIWNLVFMQYNQIPGQEREKLPEPSVDTGMGLERIAAVMQGKHDNYDIDLFRALITASEEISGVRAEGKNQASHRIIADHLRSSAFLVADGILPSNEGRGYVLRRIMRRAMRHAHLLGTKEPLMHRLTPTLVEQMGGVFDELNRAEMLITETLLLEETRFRTTLERGLGLLEEASGSLNRGDSLDGETAFRLYDTYGFPFDLTQETLRQRGISIDEAGFDRAMTRQKQEARAAWSGSGETMDGAVWFSIREHYGPTEFLGYDADKAKGIVQAIVIDGKEVQTASEGQEVVLVVNQTPFYAESGGQVGDTGSLVFENGSIKINDTQKKGKGLHAHFGVVEKGIVSTGMETCLEVNTERRSDIGANHSATHLLHEALRQTLGTHVTQKGSLVTPDRLRFDFSHAKPLSRREMDDVAMMANQIVRQALPVQTRLMAVEDAISKGAMALFGEKYGDKVRVVSMGVAISGEKVGKIYSMELCGGVHVANTGQIGIVKILGDSAVSSGVRRIEAVTGDHALKYLEEHETQIGKISALLKVAPNQAVRRVGVLVSERKSLERKLAEANKKLAFGGGEKFANSEINDIGGIRFIGRLVRSISPRDIKGLVDDAKDALGSGIVVIASVGEDGKVSIVVGVSGDIADKYNAVDLVRIASVTVGGKGGGGRPDMAQAGGPQGENVSKAIDAVRLAVQEKQKSSVFSQKA